MHLALKHPVLVFFIKLLLLPLDLSLTMLPSILAIVLVLSASIPPTSGCKPDVINPMHPRFGESVADEAVAWCDKYHQRCVRNYTPPPPPYPGAVAACDRLSTWDKHRQRCVRNYARIATEDPTMIQLNLKP